MPWHLTVLNLLSQVGTLSPPLLLPIARRRGHECRTAKLSSQGVGVGLNHHSCNEHSRAFAQALFLCHYAYQHRKHTTFVFTFQPEIAPFFREGTPSS